MRKMAGNTHCVPIKFESNQRRQTQAEKMVKRMQGNTRRMLTELRISENIRKNNLPTELPSFNEVLVATTASFFVNKKTEMVSAGMQAGSGLEHFKLIDTKEVKVGSSNMQLPSESSPESRVKGTNSMKTFTLFDNRSFDGVRNAAGSLSKIQRITTLKQGSKQAAEVRQSRQIVHELASEHLL